MKYAKCGFIGLTLVLAVDLAPAAAPRAKANDVAGFMQLKRASSHEVFDGIVAGDYAKIRRNAEAMSLLTEDELWQVLQTPEYLRFSVDFRDAAADLAKAAEQQNLDRATLYYMEMTRKCVDCHRHVRDVRMAGLDGFKNR